MISYPLVTTNNKLRASYLKSQEQNEEIVTCNNKGDNRTFSDEYCDFSRQASSTSRWEDDSDSGSSASSLTSSESNDSLSSRVSWSPTLIAKVHYRPTISSHDKDKLFYNCSDYILFRQSYKEHLMQVRLEKKRKLREEAQKESEGGTTRSGGVLPQASQEEQPQTFSKEDSPHSYHDDATPFTWIVNRIQNIFFYETPIHSTSSSPLHRVTNAEKKKRGALDIETLVDTLYLF